MTFSPAADRNKQAILNVLGRLLPSTGSVLEIASGTGQHALWFGKRCPTITWWPTELSESSISILKSNLGQGLTRPSNIKEPFLLDASSDDWSGRFFDLIYCSNMIHISHWNACKGLFKGASKSLAVDGALFLYGPFIEKDIPTANSNIEFNDSLKARNSDWGIRKLEDVLEVAGQYGLTLSQRIEMPANNLSLVFQKEE